VLAPCPARKVLIFGQCYAGIFQPMKIENAIICGASRDRSFAVPCRKGEIPPYDEFFYHLIGALSGQYPDGEPLASTISSPEAVTIYEAYSYALKQDRTYCTPLFSPGSDPGDPVRSLRL
jgi:hypothetical protein